ncbi:hypothetical protein E6Q11_02775 [Candidatus Dojkabacteria bacterium]|uniref:Uncharacterized protein n=1 Tax=Candidatus Dojkabacteria bacterium TaxID=2099670 RepID=A0A5C7J7F6_9BACT|nr:MAG: hypothetical protein E6Q11_02775 [Candidatus Dojkabacteria bacterium]
MNKVGRQIMIMQTRGQNKKTSLITWLVFLLALLPRRLYFAILQRSPVLPVWGADVRLTGGINAQGAAIAILKQWPVAGLLCRHGWGCWVFRLGVGVKQAGEHIPLADSRLLG